MWDEGIVCTPRIQMFIASVEMFPASLYTYNVDEADSRMKVVITGKNDDADTRTIDFTEPTFGEKYAIFDIVESSIVNSGVAIGEEMH